MSHFVGRELLRRSRASPLFEPFPEKCRSLHQRRYISTPGVCRIQRINCLQPRNSVTSDKIPDFANGSPARFYENNNFDITRPRSTESRRVTMLRKWILLSVSMFAVGLIKSGTPGSANEWLGPRLSAPTIPYKPGYGSLRAGGGDHYLGGWLRGCSCRQPGERNPIYYRRTNSALYTNTGINENNSSQPVQPIPPSPIQPNVASQ